MNYLDTNHYLVNQLVNTMQSNAEVVGALDVVQKTGAKLMKDGNKWCYILGELNDQNCVAAFGDSPLDAAFKFYSEFSKPINQPI